MTTTMPAARAVKFGYPIVDLVVETPARTFTVHGTAWAVANIFPLWVDRPHVTAVVEAVA